MSRPRDEAWVGNLYSKANLFKGYFDLLRPGARCGFASCTRVQAVPGTHASRLAGLMRPGVDALAQMGGRDILRHGNPSTAAVAHDIITWDLFNGLPGVLVVV